MKNSVFPKDYIQTVNGKKTIVTGKGKPLIFLHGFMSSKEAFCRQIRYFSSYFTVYAPDLTGFGENAEMPFPYSLDDYAEELKELIKFVGGKTYVAGHSFGCRIAIKTAATSDLIEKLVLCGAAGLKPAFSLKKCIKRMSYKLSKPFLSQEKCEKIFFSPDYRMTAGNLRKSFKLITSEYLDKYISKIACPTFCIFGENDRETPSYFMKRLIKQIPDCAGVTMKNCGHFCFAEKPDEFNCIVKEFLL